MAAIHQAGKQAEVWQNRFLLDANKGQECGSRLVLAQPPQDGEGVLSQPQQGPPAGLSAELTALEAAEAVFIIFPR